MTKYRSKKTVEAVRWWKDGDHPDVSPWDVENGDGRCPHCEADMSLHGDRLASSGTRPPMRKVCPGYYVVNESCRYIGVYSPMLFEPEYSEVTNE